MYVNQKTVSSLLIAIPPEHQGALETLMLEAISEDPYDAAIVKSAGVLLMQCRRALRVISQITG